MLTTVLLAATLFAPGSFAPSRGPGPLKAPGDGAQPPNFVVVLLDDIGTDKVALYGQSPVPANTPQMERLAARGMTFRNAWSMATCSPTRASLLTGRYPERNGIGTVLRPDDGVLTPLSREQVILPAALGDHTGIALGKWHLSDDADPALHARVAGFDAFSGWSDANDYFTWTQNLNGALSPRTGYYPETLAAHALRAFEHLRGPHLVYYCPRLAHAPFHTPPAHLHPTSTPGTSRFERHRQMTEAMDTILGRLLDRIDLETTYLFVISDNGSPNPTVRLPFLAGRVKGSLYEGSLRVPFFAAGPGIPAGSECHRLVQVTDFMATLLELAGEPPADGFAEDSISFAPLLTNPDAEHARTFLYASAFGFAGSSYTVARRRAIRTERYKLIEFQDEQRFELYDVMQDPLETAELLASGVSPEEAQIRDRLLGMMPGF